MGNTQLWDSKCRPLRCQISMAANFLFEASSTLFNTAQSGVYQYDLGGMFRMRFILLSIDHRRRPNDIFKCSRRINIR